MFSQLVFLPSILLLSGIMFPMSCCPAFLVRRDGYFCAAGLLPDEGRRIFRWEPVAAGSGDGNVVRSLCMLLLKRLEREAEPTG